MAAYAPGAGRRQVQKRKAKQRDRLLHGFLPVELHAELHVASGKGGGDGAEAGAPYRRAGRIQVDVIEGVKELAAELEVALLGHAESFRKPEIPGLQARPPDGVAA